MHIGDLWYLALAYGLIWLLLFVYLFSLAHREQELTRDIRVITNILREKGEMWDATPDEVDTIEAQPVEAREPYRAI